MNDIDAFFSDLRTLCVEEGIPMLMDINKKTLMFPEPNIIVGSNYANLNNFKVFRNLYEMALYTAFRVSQITGKRLPDPIHNRMVLEPKAYPFIREYLRRFGK